MLDMIEQREKELGITPDPDTAAYMTAMNKTGKYNFVTEVFIKLLGLDICAETLVVSRPDSLAGTAQGAGATERQKQLALYLARMGVVGTADHLHVSSSSTGVIRVGGQPASSIAGMQQAE